MIFNPTHWTAWQGRLPAMIDAIDAGLAEAEQDGLPPVGLCVSLLRTLSASAAAELVDALIALRHPRVVAFSTDGNEAANPAAPRACATPSNCWAQLDQRELCRCRCRRQGEAGRGVGALVTAVAARHCCAVRWRDNSGA